MTVDRQLCDLLGATAVTELGGGHQGRAFRAVLPDGEAVVAKVVASELVDRRDLHARGEVVAALAGLDPRVCRPVPIDGSLVADIIGPDGARLWVRCSELAAGTAPDPSVPSDARTMGSGLAELHVSMSSLPATPLPPVAALQAVPPLPAADGDQLIHGDLRADNLRLDGGRLRIFDLDDCGYGPPALDVALSLYVVLFDATIESTPATYHRFREHFLAGYRAGSVQPLDDAEIDRLITLRVDALAVWLDDLTRAPIGIRSSPPGWHATLRSFVATYRGDRR